MCFDELKDKAHQLPLTPGVYIMKAKDDTVIYVGKAKMLRNRVSQYFTDTVSHSPKTRLMVSKIDHFDVIVAATEFEALVLECSLIKRYQPKYNILLKDDKGYPFVRLDMREEYPQMSMVGKTDRDGAAYYGPFGSRGITQDIMDAINKALKLPSCGKKFPRDLGKGRPCLQYHMNLCAGWCSDKLSRVEYMQRMERAKQLLSGNYRSVADEIRTEMLAAADDLNFELAAGLRDALNAIEALGKKQLVTAGAIADTDVIGYGQTETKACFAVLHFSGGNLLDKEYEIFPVPEDPQVAVSALMKQYYLTKGFAPKIIFLPFETDDCELFSQLLEQRYERKTRIKVPQRGDNVRLVELAVKNAREEAERVTGKEERLNATLHLFGKMIGLTSPDRIESYDISNLSGTDIVAGMVVFKDGKPRKSDYKRFHIQGLDAPDDYASMAQVLTRRFQHYKQADAGFDEKPDLLLIDGGVTHAMTAQCVLQALQLDIMILGMVKDDRHRTRALVTPDGKEIRIDNNQAIFSFIGNIQEETHRFAISFHRKLRSKRLRYSELDGITGIGPKRKQELLKTFKSITGIKAASLSELERFLPNDAAHAVYDHFHKKEG
ncbi:MAG: excinuclease ABC subunit UvrC [Oscillospiraceae bacterium]|nr:excinuclease ABC subunit UvrC [Oscillospiraceae bacterium]